MRSNVIVLMSTYNGAQYIEEQMDSILGQNDVDVSVLVRDDGSKDSTVSVLKRYAKDNDNVVLVDDSDNLGVGNSFMRLLSTSENYDYYAFADQDDVWDNDKIRVAIDSIGDTNQPVLYCCNQRCVDRELHFLHNRFMEDYEVPSLINAVIANYFAGCTMVMNRALREVLLDGEIVPSDFFDHRIHDAWITCVALANGKIIYDKHPHMDFRRIGSNYSDEYTPGIKDNTFIRYIHKIKRLQQNKLKPNGCSYTAAEILRKYADNLTKVERHDLELLAYYDKSLISRINLLKSGIIQQNCQGNILPTITKVLLGIF